jgi:hypothetical protein
LISLNKLNKKKYYNIEKSKPQADKVDLQSFFSTKMGFRLLAFIQQAEMQLENIILERFLKDFLDSDIFLEIILLQVALISSLMPF